jgi:hypothetical protein
MGSDAVQRLLDLEAIKQLKARYLRTCDQKKFDEFRELFTADCTFHIDPADVKNLEGTPKQFDAEGMSTDQFMEMVRNFAGDAVTVHHCHTPEIEFDTADTASGIWPMMDFMEWTTDGVRTGFVGYGYYEEKYRREPDGQWRICSWDLPRLRIDPIG